MNYRATINDNMLVTVMIETLEGVAMANEIAATHGVDVIILGNNDLAQLLRLEPERSPLSGCDHQGARRGAQVRQVLRERGRAVSERYTVSADTRMVQNGPACDGWRPAGRGRGREAGPEEEPVIGLPTGGRSAAPAPPTPVRDPASCWP